MIFMVSCLLYDLNVRNSEQYYSYLRHSEKKAMRVIIFKLPIGISFWRQTVICMLQE